MSPKNEVTWYMLHGTCYMVHVHSLISDFLSCGRCISSSCCSTELNILQINDSAADK